jgi:hypothetical protein
MQKAGLIAALSFMLALTGCGATWFPGIDPNAATSVTVTALPASPLAGAPVTITATLKKSDGTAVADGTAVSFTFTATWPGTVPGVASISPSTATTTGGTGTVTTTLNANAAGTVVVTATAGTASGQVTVFIASPVTVVATPTIITTISGGPVAITATVKNADGTFVADGTVINYTATVGISTIGIFSAPTTTLSGVSTVTLTVPSGVISGSIITITATATVNSTSSSGTATVQVL